MKSSRFGEQTYYDLLEVMSDAPQHEIHAAYQRAKQTYSSDSPALYTMFTQQEARELLSLIEEAFVTLSNQTRRTLYDQQLALQMAAKKSGVAMPAPVKEKFAPVKNELPDFRVPEEPMVRAFASTSATPAPIPKSTPPPMVKKDDTPAGFARTKFGPYELRQDMEDLVRKSEEFTGSLLQKIRMYKNISLDQVIEETRINKPYLVAIEADDYAALPAPVFARGFIVQLSRLYGLNDKKVADSYMVLYKKART